MSGWVKLYQQKTIVKETFEEASDLLGFSMENLCFEENNNNETKIYATSNINSQHRFLRVLRTKGYQADAVAGLSLGVYSISCFWCISIQ